MKPAPYASAPSVLPLLLLLVPEVCAQQPTPYATAVLADAPLLYWNFDEPGADDPAAQRAPLVAVPLTTENDLQPVAGATRAEHAATGGPPRLGRAAWLDGTSYFQCDGLRLPVAGVGAPWAVEFWMKVEGDNSGDRQDYLLNFGNSGADNAPAFIYDFKPDQLEVFHGPRTDGGPVVSDGEWHHVLWVYYGTGATGVADRMEAWVDGVNHGNVRATFARDLKLSERLIVGAALPGGVNAFEGLVDEVAVYDLSGLADEAAVAGRAALLATHHANAFTANPQPYREVVLSHQPVLYWNFDEDDGAARQLAPVVSVPPDNSRNTLLPVAGATRVDHAGESGLFLGRAAHFNGGNFFRALQLDAGRAALGAPWAVEFWMQVRGDNSGDRQDYLLNFGTSPGGDNGPAFIYDYKPDQLEVFHGPRTDGGPVVSDGDWHHVVWVYYGDGVSGVADRMDVWFDGAPVPGVRNDFARAIKTNEMLLVGAALQNGIGGFDGRLDEVAIYDLSAFSSEAALESHVQGMVARHRTAALTPPPSAMPPLVISQSGGQVTISWSGNGYTLEESGSLAAGAWSPVAGGTSSPVVVTPAPGAPVRFYRLRR